MVAGHAVLRPPDRFVILQVRKTTRLGAKPDPLRKYAGQKQRMVAHVNADEKPGAVIGRFERRQHLEQVIERVALPRQNGRTHRARSARENSESTSAT